MEGSWGGWLFGGVLPGDFSFGVPVVLTLLLIEMAIPCPLERWGGLVASDPCLSYITICGFRVYYPSTSQ